MNRTKSYKLSEVAIEFNRSTTEIVKDLQSLGFSIENKPNARLSEEAYVALGQKYGRPSREKESAAAPPPPAKPVAAEAPLLAEESSLPVVGKVDLSQRTRRLPPPPKKAPSPAAPPSPPESSSPPASPPSLRRSLPYPQLTPKRLPRPLPIPKRLPRPPSQKRRPHRNPSLKPLHLLKKSLALNRLLPKPSLPPQRRMSFR